MSKSCLALPIRSHTASPQLDRPCFVGPRYFEPLKFYMAGSFIHATTDLPVQPHYLMLLSLPRYYHTTTLPDVTVGIFCLTGDGARAVHEHIRLLAPQ